MSDHPEQNLPETGPTTPPDPTGLPKRLRGTHPVQDDVPPTAAARTTPDRQARALDHVRICAGIADDNRGRDITLIDLRAATPLVDYFLVVTATSRRQGNAISSEIDAEMKRVGEHKIGIEGSEEGRWTLIDYGDFVVHIFSEEAREYYALDDVWGDSPSLDWKEPGQTPPASDGPVASS